MTRRVPVCLIIGSAEIPEQDDETVIERVSFLSDTHDVESAKQSFVAAFPGSDCRWYS